MPVFIVQVVELVQFTQYNTVLKITPSTSVHCANRVRKWRVARLYSQIAPSWKPFGIGHMNTSIFCLEWPILVLGYRSGGPGSIPGTTRKKRVVGLERGPLSP
jgi:hypothetical protein